MWQWHSEIINTTYNVDPSVLMLSVWRQTYHEQRNLTKAVIDFLQLDKKPNPKKAITDCVTKIACIFFSKRSQYPSVLPPKKMYF